MILRFLDFSRFAALLLVALGFGAAPASAGCGFCGGWGGWAPAPVVVQYYQPACSCCGCGASYYSSYWPAYAYPSVYATAGYAVAPPVAPYMGPRPFYGPRMAGPGWGPRRGLVARY